MTEHISRRWGFAFHCADVGFVATVYVWFIWLYRRDPAYGWLVAEFAQFEVTLALLVYLFTSRLLVRYLVNPARSLWQPARFASWPESLTWLLAAPLLLSVAVGMLGLVGPWSYKMGLVLSHLGVAVTSISVTLVIRCAAAMDILTVAAAITFAALSAMFVYVMGNFAWDIRMNPDSPWRETENVFLLFLLANTVAAGLQATGGFWLLRRYWRKTASADMSME